MNETVHPRHEGNGMVFRALAEGSAETVGATRNRAGAKSRSKSSLNLETDQEPD